ncbi:hypothetical protein ACHAWF_016717 [Thalassiosira exigua]
MGPEGAVLGRRRPARAALREARETKRTIGSQRLTSRGDEIALSDLPSPSTHELVVLRIVAADRRRGGVSAGRVRPLGLQDQVEDLEIPRHRKMKNLSFGGRDRQTGAASHRTHVALHDAAVTRLAFGAILAGGKFARAGGAFRRAVERGGEHPSQTKRGAERTNEDGRKKLTSTRSGSASRRCSPTRRAPSQVVASHIGDRTSRATETLQRREALPARARAIARSYPAQTLAPDPKPSFFAPTPRHPPASTTKERETHKAHTTHAIPHVRGILVQHGGHGRGPDRRLLDGRRRGDQVVVVIAAGVSEASQAGGAVGVLSPRAPGGEGGEEGGGGEKRTTRGFGVSCTRGSRGEKSDRPTAAGTATAGPPREPRPRLAASDETVRRRKVPVRFFGVDYVRPAKNSDPPAEGERRRNGDARPLVSRRLTIHPPLTNETHHSPHAELASPQLVPQKLCLAGSSFPTFVPPAPAAPPPVALPSSSAPPPPATESKDCSRRSWTLHPSPPKHDEPGGQSSEYPEGQCVSTLRFDFVLGSILLRSKPFFARERAPAGWRTSLSPAPLDGLGPTLPAKPRVAKIFVWNVRDGGLRPVPQGGVARRPPEADVPFLRTFVVGPRGTVLSIDAVFGGVGPGASAEVTVRFLCPALLRGEGEGNEEGSENPRRRRGGKEEGRKEEGEEEERRSAGAGGRARRARARIGSHDIPDPSPRRVSLGRSCWLVVHPLAALVALSSPDEKETDDESEGREEREGDEAEVRERARRQAGRGGGDGGWGMRPNPRAAGDDGAGSGARPPETGRGITISRIQEYSDDDRSYSDEGSYCEESYSGRSEEGDPEDEDNGFDLGSEALEQIRYRLETAKIDPNPEGTTLLDELLIRLQGAEVHEIDADLVNEFIDALLFESDDHGPRSASKGAAVRKASTSRSKRHQKYPRIQTSRCGKVLGWSDNVVLYGHYEKGRLTTRAMVFGGVSIGKRSGGDRWSSKEDCEPGQSPKEIAFFLGFDDNLPPPVYKPGSGGGGMGAEGHIT